MLPFNEESVVKIVDEVSHNVVNVSTTRFFYDMYYQAVPIRGVGSGIIID